MSTLVAAVLCSLLIFAYGHDDVIYPTIYAQQQLATRIHCQVEETQHFQYSSDSKVWESSGGDIKVTADVALHCLGDDTGGKYGSQALKYLAEVSNLIIKASKVNEDPLKGKEDSAKEEDGNEEGADSEDFRRMYSVPFQFVQLANGSVPEIRFSENETDDGRIRNFKRHIVDAFASQLHFDQEQKKVVESSVTGEHVSSYSISVSGGVQSKDLTQNSVSEEEEPTVTVEKLVTEKDILNFAPSEALNDKDSMRITLKQTQIYKGGRLFSSSGTSSVVLVADGDVIQKRRKREEKFDVISQLQAHSSFDLQLRRRQRRSPTESARVEMHENLAFAPVTRFADKEDNPERLKLQQLQQASGGTEQLFENLLQSQGKDYEEKLEMMYEMVHREVNLKLDKEPQSVSNIVRDRLNRQAMKAMCHDNFATCTDSLQLLAAAGGPKAEKVFLSFFLKDTFTSDELRTVSGFLADISSPSVGFLDSLVQLISEKRFDKEVLGAISLGTGSLGSKAELKTKNKIAKVFIDLLVKQKNNCNTGTFLLDILEAIGNLGSRKTVPAVLEVSRHCQQSNDIQIACAHALRHNSELPSVQQWMQSMTTDSDCEVIKAIVRSLSDKVHEQKMAADTTNWPRNGFNQVDENLKQLLVQSRCSAKETILYFGKKKDPVANEIVENYSGPEAESWDSDSKDVFASDRTIFNKNLDYSVGTKGANARIFADVFGGVRGPSEKPDYKLSSTFQTKLNFLGQEREIAYFTFYNQSGTTQAYLRILGQTRQALTRLICKPRYLKFQMFKDIPWVNFNILIVRLSLGIHLTGEVGLATQCPSTGSFQMEPIVKARVAGGAIVTILAIRGGVDLGGNFNYKLQFIFTPVPYICIRASHGYEPMSVSFEAFVQWWNFWRWRWGGRIVWKPYFLSWNVNKGLLMNWFDDKCLRKKNFSPSVYTERDLGQKRLSVATNKYRREQNIPNRQGWLTVE